MVYGNVTRWRRRLGCLSGSLRRAREGWKRVEGTCTLPGQALAAKAPAPFVRREKRKAVNGATTTNEF